MWIPVLKEPCDHHHVTDGDYYPTEPVRPGQYESCAWPEVMVDKLGERAHFKVGEEHFSHRPHDAKDEEPNDRVDQDD